MYKSNILMKNYTIDKCSIINFQITNQMKGLYQLIYTLRWKIKKILFGV